ncbi:YciI family protein [Actinomadura hibisca]|uniref:YciI family protein n=1 Tax=Actinomadura hibisca TaxID=68565 RepID=UPI00082EEF09|nr:YciI family protein [Actinomadura hibisca]
MPRYLTMIRMDESAPPPAPDPDFDARMGALFKEITEAGVMVETAGLAPTAEGTRVTWEDGELGYTDGPFTETKEVVAGYAILRAADRTEALKWVRRFLSAHPKNWNFACELREITEE